jgi:tetraacyldisaccharide 4'-kinase
MNLPLPLRILLWPISLVYGAIVRLKALLYKRGWLKSKRLKGAVISVGNLTTGGTGKTPMVIWLAEKFLAEGKRVAILSRGYRGANGTSDEIELMKSRLQNRVAFGVGKDRFAAGSQLEAQQPIDIFILDDGFQHMQLSRDANILTVDGSKKLKGEFLIPAGTLREPVPACARADLVVVTRTSERLDLDLGGAQQLPAFSAQTKLLGFRPANCAPSLPYLSEIGSGPFFAFCGIGNPVAFFSDLGRWQLKIAREMTFRDHHHYTNGDLRRLNESAKRAGATAFVTTEKDAQNLSVTLRDSLPIHVAVIDFVLSDEKEFMDALHVKLHSATAVPA